MRIVKQNRFKNLGELHKEWTEAGVKASRAPHTDVSRNLATVVFRDVLPGLRRRRTGLLPSNPKFSFQMRASFVFHLETKVLESGGRVEKLIAQVVWSPVLSFYSLWWFVVQCHLLVLVHCVFWKPTSLHPFMKTFWKRLMQMSWRPLSKKPGLPHHLSSATNWSPPSHAELRQLLKKKEPLPSIEYIYSKWTYFPEGQQFAKTFLKNTY